MLGSTHTDKEGNVVAVYDDKDLGVCKHDKNETEVLLLKLKEINDMQMPHQRGAKKCVRLSSGTSLWCRNNRAEGNIIYSDDPAQSWDGLVAWGNQHANNQDLSVTISDHIVP